jgi:hypothetical protein
MMVGWDAYYVPRWAYGHLDYFVSVSHDGFIDIEVRTQEMRDKALEILGHEMDEGSVEILIASRCPTTARSLLP